MQSECPRRRIEPLQNSWIQAERQAPAAKEVENVFQFRSHAGSATSVALNALFGLLPDPYQVKLPGFLLEQYLCPADAKYEIVLGGQMQTIWRRLAWLNPVF